MLTDTHTDPPKMHTTTDGGTDLMGYTDANLQEYIMELVIIEEIHFIFKFDYCMSCGLAWKSEITRTLTHSMEPHHVYMARVHIKWHVFKTQNIHKPTPVVLYMAQMSWRCMLVCKVNVYKVSKLPTSKPRAK